MFILTLRSKAQRHQTLKLSMWQTAEGLGNTISSILRALNPPHLEAPALQPAFCPESQYQSASGGVLLLFFFFFFFFGFAAFVSDSGAA